MRISIDGFVKVTLALSLLLLAVAALVFAVNAAPIAVAQDAETAPVAAPSGTILMDMHYNPTDDADNVLVWNSETGESKLYWFNTADQEWLAWETNLPQQPLD